MHYKRVKKHGSPDYRWGGKVVGRACKYCERPVIAREMCWRHYQMWRRHGDALFADEKKVDGLPPGEHHRRGYKMVGPTAEIPPAIPADASVERSHRHGVQQQERNLKLRDGSRRSRRQWEHRKVAGAKPGQIVHHIDGDRLNNTKSNLHVFNSPSEHAKAHRSLEKIAYRLLETGLVEFDRDSGCYRLVESSLPTKPSH